MILKVIGIAAISLAITFGIALGLIASQRPTELSDTEGGLDFTRQVAATADPLPLLSVPLRDGFAAQVRHLPGPEGAPLLVLVHGSGWDGGQFDAIAPELAEVAEVIAPDLRGHGARPGRRGDVDYIGQFEDDLADLIAAFAKPDQRVVMAGHSSGGGLVIRFAGGNYGKMIDEAILLAPFVQYDAPTTRPNSGGWARPLTRRIIGLSMINAARIHALDHLTAIQFAMPDEVLNGPEGHRATTAYSWRLNQSFAPRRDWGSDIAALPPFLLVVGTEDEAFVADAFVPTFADHTEKGKYLLVEGKSHLDVVSSPQAINAIKAMLADG